MTAARPADPPPADAPPEALSLGQAWGFWLKLGLISFGGPAGQIATMHAELVARRRWISERRFLHALNYCMVLPGPEAQQLATYIGWLMHRSWGGVVAGGLFVLPSLFILTALSWIYMRFGQLPVIAGVFAGIKPAVAAIVLQAAHRIGSRVLHKRWLGGLALVAFLAVWALDLPFPLVVGGAAVLGALGGRWAPQVFQPQAPHAAPSLVHAPALIDDHTPIPPHAQFRWPRLVGVLALGALLWLLPMGGLILGLGWAHTLTQMAWFFTKAALLTFGGAYAVLPYVSQAAIGSYGWLTPPQMMDGLALGETTPGPLIMVVAFVGFVGAYGQALFGPDQLFLAGAAAAALVTWFTFLPSFLFILAGGPLIEATQGEGRWSAPLTAISAAVVGTILNLALYFGVHVLWPQGWAGAVDLKAALLFFGSALALMLFKRSVLQVIAACALIGLMFLR